MNDSCMQFILNARTVFLQPDADVTGWLTAVVI